SSASLVPDLARAMNLSPGQRGALVQTVNAGSPAERAGLRPSATRVTINGQPVSVGGDIIVAMDGQAVRSSNDLIAILALSGSVGQTVTMTVVRDGNEVQVPVTLGARPGR
ncbi:MAG: PDZ domain-containing protein, partial [Chloroflexi bacterium]|nr:PDZ domain-containing protein [Chloroflexota bacterium]